LAEDESLEDTEKAYPDFMILELGVARRRRKFTLILLKNSPGELLFASIEAQ
jgi:hypothetical protein